jgi:nicotinate-nucleotide--dimethylbenzimidazole phosphoribosyltransferase
MSAHRPLIAPTANPVLEDALREKLGRRSRSAGSLGELEPLALRLGLIQQSLKPRFEAPQLIVFAGDHGLAVDGVGATARQSTADLVQAMLMLQLPLAVFARSQGLQLSVVDSGVAEALQPHPQLLARKIAHGTRHARVGAAMSLEQAQAAMRAGSEIAGSLGGNAFALAGIGVGADESAALVLARLCNVELQELLVSGRALPGEQVEHLLRVLHAAQLRHKDVTEPIEVLAAFGGFEMAMMVGLMLVAASRRHLLIVDGLPACAALMVASRIAPAITDYCIWCRSHGHAGLDRALALFGAAALLEMGIESTDGTGSTLAWPLLRSVAALLTEVAEGEDPGPTLPGALTETALGADL